MNILNLYKIYLLYPSVQTDTRKIKKNDLFFALKGPSFNGNTFAQQALALGAAYAVVDEPQYCINEQCILVDDVLMVLQQLARHHRQQFDIPFIAITGSNGKTTSKELVTTVLRQRFVCYATDGNLNNHIGVPLTILKIKPDAAIAVIEMGANHQKEIASYCSIALPNIGIINNCGKAHIEGFGGIEGVRKGKGELYDFIRENGGGIFRNTNLAYLAEMAQGIDMQITYGIADAQYKGVVAGNEKMLEINAVLPEGLSLNLHTRLVGEYNLPNVLLAIAVGGYFGVSPEHIKQAIEAYQPDNSRSQLIKKGDNEIIMDAYNANPTSMRAAIENFSRLEGKKILFLGAMKEMGEDEAKEHEELLAFVQQWDWKYVMLVGKEFEAIKHDFKWFGDSIEASEYIAKNKPQNSIILIKGSRGSKMEKLLEVL
ncbi:MAG: UDP-N-acetylmuramoyl-tripeptide--D-alanyl-D-alanine ligase [Phycisphaerales bacterium]|nr:UDP-N-acetylmuramoyl-tripeptide--D-alanyl-D-alanine ligase [Phycisphaerales bacterium]